jgi:hypothetical protein
MKYLEQRHNFYVAGLGNNPTRFDSNYPADTLPSDVRSMTENGKECGEK